jgi:hypothetical protein
LRDERLNGNYMVSLFFLIFCSNIKCVALSTFSIFLTAHKFLTSCSNAAKVTYAFSRFFSRFFSHLLFSRFSSYSVCASRASCTPLAIYMASCSFHPFLQRKGAHLLNALFTSLPFHPNWSRLEQLFAFSSRARRSSLLTLKVAKLS